MSLKVVDYLRKQILSEPLEVDAPRNGSPPKMEVGDLRLAPALVLVIATVGGQLAVSVGVTVGYLCCGFKPHLGASRLQHFSHNLAVVAGEDLKFQLRTRVACGRRLRLNPEGRRHRGRANRGLVRSGLKADFVSQAGAYFARYHRCRYHSAVGGERVVEDIHFG